MSWPLNAECPTCFGITGWYARYASPKNRCKCERESEDSGLTEPVMGDPLLKKRRAA